MWKRKERLLLLSCILFLLSSIWLLLIYREKEKPKELLEISGDSGIYPEGMELKVRMNQKGTIYYTENGEKPSDAQESDIKQYKEPITLYADPEGSVYTFCFFCLLEDGSYSDPVERTYLILKENRQINVNYIVSVWGKEEDLFGYEEGILVRGKKWDEFLEENPDPDAKHVRMRANFYMDKEVPVYVSFFAQNGEEIVSQNCGMKVYGAGTRRNYQKSLRLIARYDYAEVNEFAYPFFHNLFSDNTGCLIPNYQRISMHNSGNDYGRAFIRNTLCGELAGEAGFPDVLHSESAVLYVNGQYKGVYWMQNAFDDRYFSEKYGSYQGEMAVCEGKLSDVIVNEEQNSQEKESAEEYNAFCRWLRGADVNEQEVWETVTETIDVENLLQYVAVEYYVNNCDWPLNNMKVYRYVPEEGEQFREGTVFDGRYRYLLFDLDYGMGLEYTSNAEEERLDYLCGDAPEVTVFAKLMERKDCRDAFVNEVVNLGNTSFSEENINKVLNELNDSRWSELEYMVEQTDVMEDPVHDSPEVDSVDQVAQELQVIRTFAGVRRSRVLTEMMNKWDLGTLFQVSPDLPPGTELVINGEPLSADSCWYFGGVPITVSAKTQRGAKVTGYEFNGTYIAGEQVEILADSYLDGDAPLEIKLYVEEEETEELSIHSFHVDGPQDWIILENTGSVPLYLGNYFLSDNENKPEKGSLPNTTLDPGEDITIYGKKYSGEIPEGYRVGFSWGKEEPVVLSHLTNGVVEIRNR